MRELNEQNGLLGIVVRRNGVRNRCRKIDREKIGALLIGIGTDEKVTLGGA